MREINCKDIKKTECIYLPIINTMSEEFDGKMEGGIHLSNDERISIYQLFSPVINSIKYIRHKRKIEIDTYCGTFDQFPNEMNLVKFKDNFNKLLDRFPEYKEIKLVGLNFPIPDKFREDIEYLENITLKS